MNTSTATAPAADAAQKPVIELRNIKTSAFASQETHCYQADLIVDGVKWGTVGNEGHGGPDRFDGTKGFSWADITALEARIKATYPQQDVGYLYGDSAPAGTHMMEQSLEIVCGDLVNHHLMAGDLRRRLGRYYLFTKPGAEGVYEIALKGHTHEAVHASVLTKQSGIKALHLLPFEEALAIYRAQT